MWSFVIFTLTNRGRNGRDITLEAEIKCAHKIIDGNPVWKSTEEAVREARPNRENNIKTDVKYRRCEDVGELDSSGSDLMAD
jgi:hypothetical protein